MAKTSSEPTRAEPASRPVKTLRPYQREALERVATRMGVDRRHFPARGNVVDKTKFGIRALVATCVHYNPFVEGSAPDGFGSGLGQRTQDAYSLASWRGARDHARKAFFAGGKSSLYSPLDEKRLPLLGCLFGKRFDLFVLDGPHLRILLTLGSIAYGIYYPERNLFLHLTAYEESRGSITLPLFSMLYGSWSGLDEWLIAAERGKLRRAFVIADNRPAHYLTQTLGFLHTCLPQVEEFQQSGGIVAVARDWCFVDALKVFPQLRNGSLLSARSDDLGTLCLDLRLSMQRVSRVNEFNSVEWVKRVASDDGEAENPDLFPIWISIDAEKSRFENQVDALAHFLAVIDAELSARGNRLKVFWDGWTAIEGQWSDKDQRVVDKIDAITAQISALVDRPFEQEAIYGKTFEHKLGRTPGCKLALATHGTASIMPSIIRGVPTITYHDADVMSQQGYVAQENWLPIADADIAIQTRGAVAHMNAFTVRPGALVEAAEQVLAHGVRPTNPPNGLNADL